ncbi:MAG TPA: hypothetical protein VL574_15390 [Stellaceae bacterium]|nr:hypothetical protein [Stellaceae bacterium]
MGLASLASACAAGNAFDPPGPPQTVTTPEAEYRTVYSTYAEICAVSELDKKPGFGAPIFSGIGGHAVLYLNGVCREKDVDYPVLVACTDAKAAPSDGVGLSVNAHYSNAEWVAVGGRDFFFDGEVGPGGAVTRDIYHRTQDEAQAKGIYTGVDFHDVVFQDMVPGFTREAFKYEMSIATDYAITYGRNRYCGRVPLSAAQMQAAIRYLNDQNAPYRKGEEFDWNLFEHNCAHMNHNALAAAGIWNALPTDQFFLLALLDFPVPENELVNLMRRTNDMPIDDPMAMYHDPQARKLLLTEGRLPTMPGSIFDFGLIPQHNEVYDTNSKIIFYEDPFLGAYTRAFHKLLSQPRYYDLRANLKYFAGLYARIRADDRPASWYIAREGGMNAADRAGFEAFYRVYRAYIDQQAIEVDRDLARLASKTA